uniref:sialin-like n=1 Tax=Styela clava TaxID=7725 RepID=UPI00193A4B89|nr:sialin-like [Styela clava]
MGKGEDKPEEFNKDIVEETTPGCYLKSRHSMAIMLFFATFNVYSLRTNLSVAIVAMVNSTSSSTEDSENGSDVCPDKGVSEIDENTNNGIFVWDSVQQGLILGCYFYGYIFTCVPGGYLAKRYGVKPVLGITMLISSIITLLCPVMANASFPLFVTFRIILGFLQGVSFPAVQSAWGIWAPPLERSTLIAISFSGSSFGTFVTLPIAGVIADNVGWEAVFYLTGAGAMLWSLVWLAFFYSTPETHPRTSEQEKKYIVESIGIQKKKNPDVKLQTPWVAMLTSLPVWGIVVGHFASNWGNYTLMTMLPTYMANILRFNLSASGGLSALPYILQFIFTIGGGYVTDVIRSRRLMSTVAVRKLNTTLGLAVPALFVVLAGYIGCDVAAAVAFFSISVAFNALTVSGCKANTVEIAPKYGGIVYGISNTIANIPGFLAPQVVGIMLKEDDSLSQWQKVFWVSAAVYLFGAIVYLIVGSGVEQPWAAGKILKNKSVKLEGIDNKATSEDNENKGTSF